MSSKEADNNPGLCLVKGQESGLGSWAVPEDVRWRLLVSLLNVISGPSWHPSNTGTGISKFVTGRNYTVFTDGSGVT
jgi:hypothetical protein